MTLVTIGRSDHLAGALVDSGIQIPDLLAREGEVPALGRVESSYSVVFQQVRLSPPGSSGLGALDASAREQIECLGQSMVKSTPGVHQFMAGFPRLLLAGLTSPESFEIALSRVTDELSAAQKTNKLEDIRRIREGHLQAMEENASKMKEAQDAAKEAQKSGLASKIFGWFSAIASIIVGAVMFATGMGAVAGALMIAGGVLGVVSQSVQQAAADGLISKEVMDKLGPALMGLEIFAAVALCAVTFGSGLARLLARVGGQAGAAISNGAAKLAALGARLGDATRQSVNHGLKFGVQIAEVMVGVGSHITQTVSSGLEAKSRLKQADLVLSRSELTALEAVMQRLKEELIRVVEAFQMVMGQIAQMISANGQTLHNLSSRPATI